jgi:hypothetical protein
MTEDEAAKILSGLLDKMIEEIAGPPPKPNQLTALRYVHGRFESVEIDDNGQIVEPPPPCCHGGVLHAPNCKFWLACT